MVLAAPAHGGHLLARGLASAYWPGDGHGSDHVGCVAASLARYGTRRLSVARERAWARDGLHVVALRPGTGRCGEVVEVRGRGRAGRAIVLDRGPFGQLCPAAAWRVGLRLGPGCRWRGVADLSPALGALVLPPSRSRRLRGLGMGPVDVWSWERR